MPPYSELLNEFVHSIEEVLWTERTYGKHSDTRHLDDFAIPAWFLLKREGHISNENSRQVRRAA